MTSKNIGFVVIGYGHIGKRHVHFINENPNATLVGVFDPNVESISDHNCMVFRTLDEVFDKKIDFDVLVICSPNHLHVAHSLLGLENGKHILVEKPLGLTKDGCEKVLSKALTVSRQVFCVMQNRFSPPALWLKKLITDSSIGTPFMLQVNCFWNRDDRYYLADGSKHPWHGSLKKDGGILFTQFSHFIDLIFWIFGDLKNINARFKNFTHEHSTEFEDSGNVFFEFGDQGIGTLNFSTAVWEKNFESSVTIIGSKGTVKLSGQYLDQVDYCHIKGGDVELPELKNTSVFGKYKGAALNHKYVIENVIAVLKEEKPISTNAFEGLKTVEIIERIYQQR